MNRILILFLIVVCNYHCLFSQIEKQIVTVYGREYVDYYAENHEVFTCKPVLIIENFVEYPYLMFISINGVLEEPIFIETSQTEVIDTDSTLTYINNGDLKDKIIIYKESKYKFYKVEYIPFGTDWMFSFYIEKMYIKDE